MASQSSPNRARLLVIVAVVVFLVLPLIGLAVFKIFEALTPDPPPVTRTIDRDTGEVLENDPNVVPETTATDTSLITLGLGPLSRADIPDVELVAIRALFDDYSKDRLNQAFETVTIQPKNLSISDSTIKSTIRLGQTDETLGFTLRVTTNDEGGIITLYVKDPQNKHGGNYTSEPVLIFVD